MKIKSFLVRIRVQKKVNQIKSHVHYRKEFYMFEVPIMNTSIY